MITQYASFIKKYAPSWLYKLGAQSYIDHKFPRHLFIETTAACNLSCSYCPREKVSSHMDFDLFKAIIDEASRYGKRSFSLHLFGEPLLYPRIFEAIHYIKRKRKGHTVLLTTNGTLLNKKVDELIAANPDQVFWSWRPEAKFTEETKRRLRAWGRFRVRFINELVPDEEREAWRSWPNQEERALHNYGGNVDVSKWVHTKPEVEMERWPCYHLWLAPAVAWNGNLLLCCTDPHQREVLGSVNETSIASIWQSERLKEVRDGHMRREFRGICTDCDVWKQYPDMFFGWQKK